MPTGPTTPALPRLDLAGTDYLDDPVGVVRRAQEISTVALSGRGHELLGYQVAQAALRDRRLETDHMELVHRIGLPEGLGLEYKRRNLLSTLGAQHTRLRIPLAPLFGPRQAEGMRSEIRLIVERLLDEVDEEAPTDLFTAVCNRMPAELYCSWVNAPRSDVPFVMRMSDQVLQIFNQDPSAAQEIAAGYDELVPYVRERIAERKRDLSDDILSHLIRQQLDGRLTEDELNDQGVILLEGSTDNTAHQIALVVGTLLENRDRWQHLLDHPGHVRAVLEESIRLTPRTLGIDRWVREEGVEIDGVAIPVGRKLVVNVQAAQRDPRIFRGPDAFDPHREGPGALTFGGGASACLGANVARMETEVLLSALIERYPRLQLAGEFRRTQTPYTADVKELPVVLRPRP
jgi:cytochrome P450